MDLCCFVVRLQNRCHVYKTHYFREWRIFPFWCPFWFTFYSQWKTLAGLHVIFDYFVVNSPKILFEEKIVPTSFLFLKACETTTRPVRKMLYLHMTDCVRSCVDADGEKVSWTFFFTSSNNIQQSLKRLEIVDPSWDKLTVSAPYFT